MATQMRLTNVEFQNAIATSRKNLTALEFLAMDCECSITEEKLTQKINAVARLTESLRAEFKA